MAKSWVIVATCITAGGLEEVFRLRSPRAAAASSLAWWDFMLEGVIQPSESVSESVMWSSLLEGGRWVASRAWAIETASSVWERIEGGGCNCVGGCWVGAAAIEGVEDVGLDWVAGVVGDVVWLGCDRSRSAHENGAGAEAASGAATSFCGSLPVASCVTSACVASVSTSTTAGSAAFSEVSGSISPSVAGSEEVCSLAASEAFSASLVGGLPFNPC